jgi:hypothetical protein
MWEVYVYIHSQTGVYDGKGSSAHMITRIFNDQPSAQRWAQHMVEKGPGYFAKVEQK